MSTQSPVNVNLAWCKGCGLCISVCPKGVLALDRKGKCVVAEKEKCIKCRMCENICPDFAIVVEEKERSGENING